MNRTNLSQLVHEFASRKRGIAFVHRTTLRTERWTYARIAQSSFRFARELESRGIGRGDRVLIWGENRAEWVVAFYGSLLCGAVVVPLDEGSAADFARRVIEQVSPKLLVLGEMPLEAIEENTTLPPHLALERLERDLRKHSDAPYPAIELDASETAQIIFTSGTTATPKGVRITHANVLSNLEPLEEEIQKYLKWERPFHPIRFLNLVPLSHVFGQFMGIYVPALIAGEVHFAPSYNPAQIVDLVKRERISVIVAVPRILQTLRSWVAREMSRRIGEDKFAKLFDAADSFSAWRRWWVFRRVHRLCGLKFWAFISGGATLDAETERFWRRLGFAVIQGYGMTETASLVSVNHPFKMSSGSIGKVLPGQEIKLDESGEILVRGRNVTPGYWTGSADGDSEDGWFRTGDIGEIDAEGNLFFKGRKKNVIVTGAGLNVYPEDLELALSAQSEILASTVVGVETQTGPEAVAVLILRNDEVDPKVAVERANEQLADYQQIRRWVVWPDRDFPRTATQKVRQQAVAEFVQSRLAGTDATRPAADPLAHVIESVLQSGGVRLDDTSTLGSDLGLDSLARVELLSAIEDRYQVDIDEAAFTATTTVGDLERMLREGAPTAETIRYPFPRWAQRFPVSWIRVALLYLVVLPFCFVMSWVATRGRKHLADVTAPVLFVSNHIASVDAALILSALPGRFRRWTAIAMSGEVLRDYVRPPAGTPLFTRARLLAQYMLVATFFNVFPLPQRSGFRRAFAMAGELVDRGYNVLVFPEGARTEDGLMHEFKRGAGVLATQLGIPVVPVRIDGLYPAKVESRYFLRPGTVTISFGRPRTYSLADDPETVADELYKAVQDLEVPTTNERRKQSS